MTLLMLRAGVGRIGMLLTLGFASLAAHAHKPSDAYLQLQVQGTLVEQRLDVALRDLDRDLVLDANDDGQLTWGEVRSRWAQIEALLSPAVSLQADGQACSAGPWGTPLLDEHSDGRYAVLTRRWSCPQPVQQLALQYSLFGSTDPSHRGVVRVRRAGGADLTAVVAAGAAPRSFALAPGAAAPVGARSGFVAFVAEGVHHILIGADHILFLLALLLPALVVRQKPASPGPRWEPAPALRPVLWDVLRVVTAFTVAHSITLALATLEVIDPPSRWIESIIAASVVLAAVNNLFPLFAENRWRLTFVFGLVHGFGFAGALKDIGLTQGALVGPLLGFNLGVELGQLAIVAAFLVLTWKLRATAIYRVGLLMGGSVLIALLALAWFAERAFNLQLGL